MRENCGNEFVPALWGPFEAPGLTEGTDQCTWLHRILAGFRPETNSDPPTEPLSWLKVMQPIWYAPRSCIGDDPTGARCVLHVEQEMLDCFERLARPVKFRCNPRRSGDDAFICW